jgi:hypothetical protein
VVRLLRRGVLLTHLRIFLRLSGPDSGH